MRSPTAAALLLALSALCSECHSAQSNRPRQRSGPIRSVPVAADIKTDADFNCPEEFGYYPHPTDCSLYYVCVFGGALLESCTGGLMYSHELQTCDWPRNVGCDATSVNEDPERLNERDPPPPPPRPPPAQRRAPTPPPPPPPRAQPNPVVTSRGQPKLTRDEYEKQQQLYEEVDDLPPAEEIENDRQQRVYRGQPSTIGQVQRDRDGYAQINTGGRTLNPNIIPASINNNNGKIGSFSFGTQVQERRPTITQAPQTYIVDLKNNVTDIEPAQLDDIENNLIDSVTELKIRQKRETIETTTERNNISTTSTSSNISISERNDGHFVDYIDPETLTSSEEVEDSGEDIDRGKRQIRHGRYYAKTGYRSDGKTWPSLKPHKFHDIPQLSYSLAPSSQNLRYHSAYNNLNPNNYFEGVRKPTSQETSYATAKPYFSNPSTGDLSHQPFKPSSPDLSNQHKLYDPVNSATQIITKSPPISLLSSHENPFTALAGGFFNNNYQKSPSSRHQANLANFQNNRPSNGSLSYDASHISSTVVTGRPTLSHTPSNHLKYRPNQVEPTPHNVRPNDQNSHRNEKPENDKHNNLTKENSNEQESSQEDSSETGDDEDDDDDEDEHYHHQFPEPPYEFTHPSNKFADIKNPFADPNFDFDEFLSKLRGDHKKAVAESSPKPNRYPVTRAPHSSGPGVLNSPTTPGTRPSKQIYQGMSTPRPFSFPTVGPSAWTIEAQNGQSTTAKNIFDQFDQKFNPGKIQQQQISQLQQNSRIPLEALKPRLQPPNFKDERQIPLSFNFNQAQQSARQIIQLKDQDANKNIYSPTQKPYLYVTGTRGPFVVSTHNNLRSEKLILQSQFGVTPRPNYVNGNNPNYKFNPTTSRPLSTIANEHLSALQQFWQKQSEITARPVTELPKLESLFSLKPTAQSQSPGNNPNNVQFKLQDSSPSTKAPTTRRPIPKPSPEMSDYYYDDEDEQYYYEPAVKPKYMPSSEVRPQRPQNYLEYEDDDNYEDAAPETNQGDSNPRRPPNYNTYKVETVTRNPNDVSVGTKPPYKDYTNNYVKNSVPVMLSFMKPTPTVFMRPQVADYKIHHTMRNRTVHMRPFEMGPNTVKPPKYLNQTTLRPYTVRHRLAKPTASPSQTTQNHDDKTTRGRVRHQNLVTQTIKMTTPRDSHNQETRYTKTHHDGRTNSLEPTESVTPTYSANHRPKMLYNGSQSYNPDQFDPYYAVYDEDGELYKDNDYVQQYNLASLRPAVQQTYRGTPPPPVRRPAETFTARPVSAQDYDDALLQGQIVNQNQYQSAIRHSTRGEGNELEYDNNPSSVRTTLFEATSISTTPSTTTSTSTTTTTQRPTVAPFTEAMIPTRYTQRSPSDENPVPNPETSQFQQIISRNSSDFDILPIVPDFVNFSSLAKPFEKTDNTYRLKETTDKHLTTRLSPVTNRIETNRSQLSKNDKKYISLTTGFSIRQNKNNTNNPYTITIRTRPFDRPQRVPNFNARMNIRNQQYQSKEKSIEYEDASNSQQENIKSKSSSESMRRVDSSPEIITEERTIPLYNWHSENDSQNAYIKKTTTTTAAPKYILKTVIKRPIPFTYSTEEKNAIQNNIDTHALIEKAFQIAKGTEKSKSKEDQYTWNRYSQPETLDITEQDDKQMKNKDSHSIGNGIHEASQHIETTTVSRVPLSRKNNVVRPKTLATSTSNPSYYSYRLFEDTVPDKTTEVFSSKAKNLLKVFLNNVISTPKTNYLHRTINTTPKTTTTTEITVNIGFNKKYLKYSDEKPKRNNIHHLQIINDNPSETSTANYDTYSVAEPDIEEEEVTTQSYSQSTISITQPPNRMTESTTNYVPYKLSNTEPYLTKFNRFLPEIPEQQIPTEQSLPDNQQSVKFHNLISETPKNILIADPPSSNYDVELTRVTESMNSDVRPTAPNRQYYTTSTPMTTTPMTTTTKTIDQTTTTRSLSFPTRASRVNPAIKLAAANHGGGRRSYQSSTKCSSDNSLQENPKCNEIKYQRPSNTRGRGSAHYSTLSGSDAQPPQAPNRGTPPTRSRPTLKPSTSIVSKSTEFIDIYAYPPRRPSAVYPQPTPDKTAAKCRKDVCLLPDCYCGGKDVPGEMPVESVPQIVLLTFDDSVNDLNKGLYTDLFEKGRVNPNGCPISATFYVSHEWTDYSQVQNLYAAGHEMASHTISHSFGEQFSQKKWNREVAGQREILAAYGGVKLEDVRGMRAPFLSVGGNRMFKMLYDSNFTYDSSLPVYENRPPSWPYTLDYKLFHDCMIPPCPTKSYPGVWEVPMVMWQDLNGGRCSMGDACANPPNAEGVYKMILKNFDRHYTTNRAPFGLYYHAAWFTQPHHKEGFIMFLDFINQMSDVWIVTNWQALQWVRDPTPINRLNNFQPFQCDYHDRPKKCSNPKVCNLWHKSGVRYMKTCQPCPEIYPWTGKSGIRSSRIDNDIEE